VLRSLDKPHITARAGLLHAQKHGAPIWDTTETGSHTTTKNTIAMNVGPRFRKIRPRSNMSNDLRAYYCFKLGHTPRSSTGT
jgi:hypothetical protein